MTHPNNEIRCPYCGAREAKVNAEVTGAIVLEIMDVIQLPALPGTIHVSENAEAYCVACENTASFGAWQGMAGHMPADVPEPTPAELMEQMRGLTVEEVEQSVATSYLTLEELVDPERIITTGEWTPARDALAEDPHQDPYRF